ncbi:hypothetical protein NG895_09140 [Aeoliella sp. ICT_H6.2]|uniref:Uncharacterized protein n=1 Tax=Aeoliella straminimaris TaxID=2954799 RepID=A0A9X2F821_9BACT|nr:hypothetical protein [Aeoliella straminimaris]MCO6044072.1 hypothetical protein [Aeoliella straminimaris]
MVLSNLTFRSMYYGKRLSVFAAVIAVALTSSSVFGIQINISLDSNTSENPSWDQTGSLLRNTFLAAADIWEDLLPGPGTFDVDVEWDDDIGSNTLGLWTEYPLADNTIEINPNFDWYYDSSPSNHSEFNFTTKNPATSGASSYFGGQWLYGDLSASERSSWFTGAPPSVMEVGYRGYATSPSRQNQFDLLSVVLHELGHELGVNTGEGPYEAQPSWIGNFSAGFNGPSGDGGHLAALTTLMTPITPPGTRVLPSAVDVFAVADVLNFTAAGIDLDRKEYVAGSGLWSNGIGWIGGTFPDGDDDAFIRSPTANPTVDLSANASARNLFVGQGDNLSTNSHSLFVSNTVTANGLDTDIFVDTGGLLDTNNLFVQNQAELQVLGGSIDAFTLITRPDTLLLGNGGSGNAGGVHIRSVLINDGTIRATNGLTLSFTTSVPSSSTVWNLDGTGEDGVLDARSGNISFPQGRLTDAFNGTMMVGAARTLYIDNTVNIETGGLVSLQGGTSLSTAAVFRSSSGLYLHADTDLEISGFAQIDGNFGTSGDVTVEDSGNLEITGPGSNVDGHIELGDSADLDIASSFASWGGTYNLGSGSLLNIQGSMEFAGNGSFAGQGRVRLQGDTRFFGGTYSTAGVVEQIGNALVDSSSPTILNGNGTWDLDGNSGDTVWTVNSDLTLNVSRIETGSGTQIFNGRIDLNGSGTTMTVNTSTAWTLDGRLDLDDGTVLAGSAQMNVTGTVNAETSRITAPVAFKSGTSVVIGAGDVLQLDGTTNYEGGAYRGGTIQQDGTANVTANTTLGINVYQMPPIAGPPATTYWLDEFDWDGSVGGSAVTNIASGVTFIINAVQIDGIPTTDGYDGTLNINGGTLLVNTGTRTVIPLPPNASAPPVISPTPWLLDGTMNLQGIGGNSAVVSSQYGSPLHIHGVVTALGGNTAMSGMAVILEQDARINVENGATLSTGLNAQGMIEVQSGGVLRLNSSSTLQSAVRMTIDGTAEFTSNATFQGGTYQGTGTLSLQGNANISQDTVLGVNSRFETGSNTQIAAGQELQLSNDAVVEENAVIQGDGALHNLIGSHLALRDGAVISAQLINQGTMSPGSSPGTAMVEDLELGETSVVEMEINGLAVDRIIGNVQLGGRLDIFVNNPAPGVAYNIFKGEITGMFDDVSDGSRIATADGKGSFVFDCNGSTCSLSEYVASPMLAGDYNNDGIVNIADYPVFRDMLGATGIGLAADGNGDGLISVLDYDVWKGNFGKTSTSSAGYGHQLTVPEPAAVTSLLLAIAIIGLPSMRCRCSR